MCIYLRLVSLNIYFYDVFLTKNKLKKGIWKMIVVVNKATKDTFSCLKILFLGLKIREKRVYTNDRKILPWNLKKCPG